MVSKIERKSVAGGVLILFTGLGRVVLAQTVPAAPLVPVSGLDEIIVTAQRRSENAQDIPLSISAFSGETLENRGIVSTEDLAKITPGLNFGSASLQRNELYLRGIGSDRFDAGGESSSGVFLDDIYQPRFSNLLFNLLDVDRVEVLKGPQGTLYGRNTIGGAIAVYTPMPSDETHIDARADVGSQNLYGGMAAVSGPISRDWAASISVGYRRRDGFMRDTVSGETNGSESTGTRIKLVYTPTDQWNVTFTASSFDTTEDAVLLARGTGSVYLLSPVIPQPGPISNPYDSAYSTPGGSLNEARLASVRINYTTDDLTLASITAYEYTHDKASEDGDSSQYDAFNYLTIEDSHAASQEFRVNSVDSGRFSLGRKLTWVGGLYFFKEHVTEPAAFRLGDQSVFATIAGPLYPSVGILDNVYKTLVTKSSAVFGQATYALTDALNVTVGGRYSYDQKNVTSAGTTNLPGFPLVAADFSVPAKDSWGKFTPKITLDYEVAEHAKAYATWSEGYKSGATQTVTFDPRLASRLVNPETVKGYEVGLKSEFFDRRVRVNTAFYDNQFKDLQVRTIVDLGNGVAEPQINNAASSTIRGAEMEAGWVATDHLSLDLGYNYLDAYYGTFVSNSGAGVNGIYSGNRLPRAPRNSASLSIRYDIPLPEDRKLSFSALTSYTSLQFFQPDNNLSAAQNGYQTTDLSITYGFAGGRLQIIGWVKNVLDKGYEVYAEEDAPSVREGWGDKRSGGITVRYRQ